MTGILSKVNQGVCRVDDRDLAFEQRGERWATVGFTDCVNGGLEHNLNICHSFFLWWYNVAQNVLSQKHREHCWLDSPKHLCDEMPWSASSLRHNDVQEKGKKKRLLNHWFWRKVQENRKVRNEKVWALKREEKGMRDRKGNERKKGSEWWNRGHYLLTLMSFQSCMAFFLLRTKENILQTAFHAITMNWCWSFQA